jgi:hypothetical protein
MIAWISITVKVTVLLFYHSNVRRGSGVVGRSWREFGSLVRRGRRVCPVASLLVAVASGFSGVLVGARTHLLNSYIHV